MRRPSPPRIREQPGGLATANVAAGSWPCSGVPATARLVGVADRFEYCAVRVDGDDGPIVEDFWASIPASGLTAMIGPSGVGKTTLLRLLNRLDDPDHGAVLLDGIDVRDYDVLELRRRVQHVGQVPVTFPGSVAENIGPRTNELLARVGLPA